MAKKKEKKKVLGVDFIYETVELNKKFIFKDDYYGLIKAGTKIEVLKAVYIREINADSTSHVSLDTVYLADGDEFHASLDMKDFMLDFFMYATPYEEPNSINFIKGKI